jgi:hypothetical protein
LTTSSDPVVKVTSLKFFEYGDSISDLVNYELMEGEWLDGDQMSVESITKNNEDVYTTGAAFELKGFTEEGTKSTLQWVVDYTNACSEDPYENMSSIAWLQFVSLAFVPLSAVAKSICIDILVLTSFLGFLVNQSRLIKPPRRLIPVPHAKLQRVARAARAGNILKEGRVPNLLSPQRVTNVKSPRKARRVVIVDKFKEMS